MIEGITKREAKKDLCDYVIILKVLFYKWFLVQGTEP
jgi:hypothetical protein